MGTTTVITSDAVAQLETDVTELTTKLNGVIIEYNKVQADMSLNKLAIDDIKLKMTNHKGKIDTLISDVKTGTNNHTSKIDTLISDVGKIGTLVDDIDDIKLKITGSYSPSNTPGGTVAENGLAADPILLRLERLDEDYVDLEDFVIAAHSGRSNSRGGNSSTNTTPMNSLSTLTTASSGSAASSGTASGVSSGTADESSAATRDDSTDTAEASVTPSYSTGAIKVITIGTKGEVRAKRLSRQTLNRLRK